MRFGGAAVVILTVGAVLAGCSTTYPTPLVPGLFPPPMTAPVKDPLTIWLNVDHRDQSFRNPPLRHYPFQVEMPIAVIVEAAGLRALGETFDHVSAGPRPADAGGLRLQVSGVAMDLKSELVYFIPLPYISPSRVDLTVRLVFTVQVLGPDGDVQWTRDYDSGRELWVQKKPSLLIGEPVHEGVQRVAHELSMRLMRQAAQDLRSWVEQERRRERVL